MHTDKCVTFFSGIHSNKPRIVGSHQDLLETFQGKNVHLPHENKKEAAIFSLCTYGQDKSRNKQNILAVHGIVLDIDDPQGPDDVDKLIHRLNTEGWSYSIYSTYTSNVNAWKLRVIVFLSQPVSPQSFEEKCYAARFAELIDVKIDSCCEQSTQVYFIPSCLPGTENAHFCHSKEGRLLDEAELPALKNINPRNSSSKEDDTQHEEQTIFQEIVDYISDGIEPIYCGGKFWIYGDGVWSAEESDWLQTYAFNIIFNRKIHQHKIKKTISWAKMATFSTSLENPHNIQLANFDGKTVDLKSGEIVENSPNNNLVTMIPHSYDPEATCPLFFNFLQQIFEGDPDTDAKITYLQQWLGYLLMPTSKFQQMLWLVGPGANGKSILTGLIIRMLGKKNISTVPLSKMGDDFTISQLHGKLANVTDEAGADYLIKDQAIKEVVGGSLVNGNIKYENAISFDATTRLIVSTNHLPKTKDASHGYFRRLAILELNRIFTKAEQDPDLLEKLQAEMSGIVRFAIEGAGKLLRDGKFIDLLSSQEALERYKHEANTVRQFVNEALIPCALDHETDKPIKILKIDLYALYREYCRLRGNIPVAEPTFGKRMKELELADMKSSGKTYWLCGLADPSTWLPTGMEIDPVLRSKVVHGKAEHQHPASTQVRKKLVPAVEMFEV